MIPISRRSVLGGGFIAAASLVAPSVAQAPQRFFGPGGETIGLQVYTLGDAALRNLDASFGRIAAIGYRAVELLTFAHAAPADVLAALKRSGLSARSMHTSFRTPSGPNLTTGFDQLVTAATKLGMTYIVPSMFDLPERLSKPGPGEDLGALYVRGAAEMTADDWKCYAGKLNKAGAALQKHGLRIAHHNHNLEFNPVGATTGFDLIAAHSDPALVSFEIDIGWVAAAGHDPVAVLKRYPGRFSMMHMKDIAPSTVPNFAFKQTPAIPGEGKLDWSALLPAAKRAGVTGYYVEQEGPFPTSRIDAVRQNYAYLSTLTV